MNKKANRCIPIKTIRTALLKAFQNKYDINIIIDDYVQKEAKNNSVDIDLEDLSSESFKAACNNGASSVLNCNMDKKGNICKNNAKSMILLTAIENCSIKR